MPNSTLEGIFLQRFQSIFEPTFISLKGLTFLFGPNSAGKSSIIDALTLLKEITASRNQARAAGEKIRAHVQGKDSRIGIEIRAADLTDRGFDLPRNRTIWKRSLEDGLSGFDQSTFFKHIKNQKVQLEFSDDFNTLKVAVNGEQIFWVKQRLTIFDQFGFPAESDDNSSLDVFGEVIIYRNNALTKKLFNSIFHFLHPVDKIAFIDHSKCYNFNQFIEITDDIIRVKGISLQIADQYQGELVALDDSVQEHLFPSSRAKDFKAYGRPSKQQRDWLNVAHPRSKFFKDEQTRRTRLYWELEDVKKEFDQAVEGILMLMADALDISIVRGDRPLLSSIKPYSATSNSRDAVDVLKPMVSENSSTEIEQYAELIARVPLIRQLDFPNHCLECHLTSLSQYRFVGVRVDFKSELESHRDQYNSYAIYLKVRQSNKLDLGFEQVGSGLSFIFPILTSLGANPLTIVEQPELHLHPKAQGEIGDVFIAAYKRSHRAVIESHSEHLLLRVLRRIRETTTGKNSSTELGIHADEISIYYFDPIGNGVTRVKQIRIDDHGELLDSWPGGFFSEREGELF